MKSKLSLFIVFCFSLPSFAGGEVVPDGESEQIQTIVQMIEKKVREKASTEGKAQRDAHVKHHGCVKSQFTVDRDIPEALRKGIFRNPGESYQAWIRYSNGSGDRQDDSLGDARGMAIKLMGVPGEKILDSSSTQDFLMINYPIFFIRNVHDYVNFFKSPVLFFGFHWHELSIANQIRAQKVEHPILTTYYSTTPYQLGENAIKFSVKPCANSVIPQRGKESASDFLREGLVATLAEQEVCLDFRVQLQEDSKKMPVEDPTVEWDEKVSPFRKVAEIRIQKQSFDSFEQMKFCENLSFNPWHSLPEHKPLGGINRAREKVYNTIARIRRTLNQVPEKEPESF